MSWQKSFRLKSMPEKPASGKMPVIVKRWICCAKRIGTHHGTAPESCGAFAARLPPMLQWYRLLCGDPHKYYPPALWSEKHGPFLLLI